MARSVWKGPFVHPSLLKKIDKLKNEPNKKPIKTWSRHSTIIPDLDSSNEITPSQLVGVIDVIEDNNVKVIFIEAEAPSVYAETIVAETGIKAVEGLWVETLKPGQTYPEFLIAAVELIVENLSNTD